MSDDQVTFHLLPTAVWEAQRNGEHYEPEGFAGEGFIHCTDGEARVIETANRHCIADPRPYVLLTLERAKISAPIIYEDPNRVFPHIYGKLNIDAVSNVRSMQRDESGRFTGIGSA